MRPLAMVCSSARATCGLPQKFSNMRLDRFPDFGCDHCGIAVAIDDANPLWLRGGKLQVRVADFTVKFHGLIVHAGLNLPPRTVTRSRPFQAGFEIDID